MTKLADKAKRISFEDDDGSSGAGELPRPRTGVGLISASIAMGRGVEAENRDLRSKLDRLEDATVVELIDPKRIRPSRFANRHELSFTSPDFESLKAEIAAAGRNVQPIKVRPIGEGADEIGEFEIAFGHRRHRACLELGLPVAAIVEELSDSQLFGEMERENRERQDLSPWEQGVMYRRALDEGLFPSLRKLSTALGVQAGNVSTAIQLASLPDEVVAAFPSPLALQFRWGAVLSSALGRDPDHVLSIAKKLAATTPKLAAKDVLARLTGEPGEPAAAASTQFESKGAVVAQCARDLKGNISLRIKSGALSAAKERRLMDFVRRLLE